MGKTYRAVQRGDMTPANGTRNIFMLDKLRASGLPDARAKAGNGYVAPVIQIYSVPSGCFLSLEQIEASKRGKSIIDASQCTPVQLDHDGPPLLEHAPRLEPAEPAAHESAQAEPSPTP